jgi:hypothetical protein
MRAPIGGRAPTSAMAGSTITDKAVELVVGATCATGMLATERIEV